MGTHCPIGVASFYFFAPLEKVRRCALLGMKVKFLRRKRIQLCQKNLKLLGHDTLRKPELLRIFPQKVCPNLRCPQAIGANANARQCRNER